MAIYPVCLKLIILPYVAILKRHPWGRNYLEQVKQCFFMLFIDKHTSKLLLGSKFASQNLYYFSKRDHTKERNPMTFFFS